MVSRVQDLTRAFARWYLLEVVAVVFCLVALTSAGIERIGGITIGLAFAALAGFQRTSTSSGWRRVIRWVLLMVGMPALLCGLTLGGFAVLLGWRGLTHPEAGAAVLAALVLLPASLIPLIGGWLLLRMGLEADRITVPRDLRSLMPSRRSDGGAATSTKRAPSLP